MKYLNYYCSLAPLIHTLRRKIHAFDLLSEERESRNSLYFIKGLQGTYAADLLGLREELSQNGKTFNKYVTAMVESLCSRMPACKQHQKVFTYVRDLSTHLFISYFIGSSS